jgi:dephospho-CoA kinase
MITIAVTGGIGAGKSETVKILQRLGACAVSADRLGHATYAKGTPGYDDMVEAFGYGIIGPGGEINRRIVGKIVFADEAKRQLLEAVTWHRIRSRLEESLVLNTEAGITATVIEAAVLFEAGWDDLADVVWTVEATYHERLARITEISGMNERYARSRMDAQLKPETRAERADEVIRNDGDLKALERRVTKLWKATTNT